MVKIEATIVLPEGFEAEKKEGFLTLRKAGKELKRNIPLQKLDINIAPGEIKLKAGHNRDRPLVGTYKSHIKNMISGLNNPFEYQLRICSSHFPMSAKVQGNEILVQNFFGGKHPLKVKIPQGVEVKVAGENITVKSADVELAGRVSSDLEQATRLNNKDRRIFSDGVFIIKKPE